MTKRIRTTVLGLSILAAGTGVAAPASAHYHNLVNEGFCLAIQGGDPVRDTHLITWACEGRTNQHWISEAYGGGYDRIYSQAANPPMDPDSMCIALHSNGAIANGTQSIIWNCTAATTDQAWQRVHYRDSNGHPCYYFKNKKAADAGYTRLLSVQGGTPGYGTNVILWNIPASQVPNNDQLWCEYDN